MKNPKRLLAVVSMSLAAAGLLGLQPLTAASAAAAEPAARPAAAGAEAAEGASSPHRAARWDDDYVVGYYNNQWQCNKAGHWGRKAGAWSDFFCYPARVPGYGWVWVLEVEEDCWHWDSWNGGWPKSWPYRPKYLVSGSYHIGGVYKHPFKYVTGIEYGPSNYFPKGFPVWKKPYFPYPGSDGPYEGPDDSGYPTAPPTTYPTDIPTDIPTDVPTDIPTDTPPDITQPAPVDVQAATTDSAQQLPTPIQPPTS